MHDARVVGQLRLGTLQDFASLELPGVCLVGEVHRLVDGERVKDLRLVVVRILRGEPPHRRFVGERPRVLVHPLVVLEEGRQRLDPVALAFGPRRRGAGAFDGLPATLERRGREGRDQRVQALADRHAPPRHGAVGLRLGKGGEGLPGGREVEGVQHRQRVVEALLRLRGARDREVHAAEVPAVAVLVRLGGGGGRRQQRASRGQQGRPKRPVDRLTEGHGNLRSPVIAHARGRPRRWRARRGRSAGRSERGSARR
jgi:hypothetical protein